MKSASEFIRNLDFNSVQLLRCRYLSKNEFLKTVGDESVYEALNNSKAGFIKVWKISDNPGIEKNKIHEGATPAFGEHLSVYISNPDSWFYTSVIQHIDWDNHQFETMNSIYKFEFDELDIDDILSKLNASDVTVKIVNKSNNELPDYATRYSAGVDLRAELGDQPSRTLNPGERCLVLTGLYIALPEGYEAQIRPRSGLALKHGVTVLNAPGTIDAEIITVFSSIL